MLALRLERLVYMVILNSFLRMDLPIIINMVSPLFIFRGIRSGFKLYTLFQ